MLNSIRTRLTLAFLGLAAGPLLIVGTILILKAFSVQTRDAIILQREMASHLSSRVQTLIRDLQSGMQTLIRIIDFQKLEPEQRKLILSIFHSKQSAIDDLILLDAGGRVLSRHSRLKLYQESPNLTRKDLDSFMVPIRRGATYFGPVRFQELSGEPLMIMAVPIIALDTGKLKGVLVADVRLKEVWDLVADIRPGLKGASFIVDADKRVIAHTNPSVVLRGTSFDPTGFDGVQTGLDGQKSILVSQVIRLGTRHFHILVEGPVSEALALAKHTVHIMLTIVAIALLTAGGLGFLTVRRIVRPIEDIAETARAIDAGDLTRRVVVNSGDELGVLAGAFNKMTLQLETLINDLEKRVAARTAELEASNKELEAFAYSVSHDLRAPLRAIDGFSQILFEEYEDGFDSQGKDCLQRVRTATQRMGQLIDDILSLSRIIRSEMNIQEADLSEMVREISKTLRTAQPERSSEFIIAEGIRANVDIRLFRIVIENLMRNAWKFSSAKPFTRIEFGMLRQEDQPVYFICDNGAGFDMRYAQKLFGAFQRLHATSEFPGTGIGLATVQRIIHRHGGRIWAEGEVEKGASFYFTLS